MNDAEVDAHISKRIRDLDLTLPDFIHGRIDMSQILTEGKYDQFNPYGNFSIPLKDVIRYWWNRIVDQDAIIDMALDDIFTEYKDRMLPRKDPEEPAVTSDVLDEFLEAV